MDARPRPSPISADRARDRASIVDALRASLRLHFHNCLSLSLISWILHVMHENNMHGTAV